MMNKNRSSRTSKTSNNKFEHGTLSQRSLNNIDESWRVIGNLKSGMRDLEDKLSRYSDNIKILSSLSNCSFNTSLHSPPLPIESKNQLFTSTSFNSALKHPILKKSSNYPLVENTIMENSYLSTSIQACDPSFGFKSSLSNNDFTKMEINPDVKFLNDLSSNNLNTSNLNFNSTNKRLKTTKVDVHVPSDKKTRVNTSSKTPSMISKDKLTRKTSSESTKRSTSEDVKYSEFMQPSSSSFLQQQQRILHRENDILPITSNQPSSITKRHLSSASFNNIVDTSNRYHDFVKPPSRKIAFTSKNDPVETNEDLIRNPVSKLNVKEEADRLLGLTQKKSKHNLEQQSVLQFNKPNGIITTSSWRVGEAIAQKHAKQIEPDTKNLNPYQLQYNPRSSSAPLNQSPQSAKKTKRTECHLVQAQSNPKNSKTISNNVSSPQLNKNKQKPYDLNDIQKYIQSQKTKRLSETKSEKEKQKIQDEERKKKLQELYRKQRLQAMKSAQMTQQSSSKLNNSSENRHGSHNNSANNSTEKAGSSKLYEQDMSKMLMDRISHLLNDNDKLVEKQRKQYLNEKSKPKKKVDFNQDEIDEIEPNDESSNSSTSLNSINLTPMKIQKPTTQKHDRLKKICSMALDLQTKLQQTKLKLFGFNPTDEEEDMMEYYPKKSDNTFITSTKHEIDDELIDESNLIHFDRVFKQDVRENTTNYPDDDFDFNDETSRPGVSNIKNYKFNLTPDLAARRIQQAYRLYTARRKANLVRKPSRRVKKENVRPSLKTEQIMSVNNPKDGYNFLSVYKKKSGLGGTQAQSSVAPVSVKTKNEGNYTEDFMTFNDTRIPETDKLSTIKSSSSSGSSSLESSSLSKYITNSKSSRHVTKPSRSIEVQPMHDESQDSTSASVSSTSTITSSYSKTAQQSSRPKSVRDQPQPIQKPKTRLVQDYVESKDPKRYSPASLERLLNAGINYLDTLNTSALQLEELDKIRCVGFAQQDTVALAHYLKEKNNVVKNETKPGKSRSSSLTSNSSSTSSASTTVSSSSYNETESDTKNVKSSVTSKKLSEQLKPKHRSFGNAKELEQDISIINTISELNDTKTDTRIRTEIDDEEVEMEKSFRQVLPSEMHIKKSRQDHRELKDQSLYDLSQSSFCSNYDTHPNVRLSFEDDSFKKFTGEIVKKYMQEEELRSKHQADLLKIREKALIEKTKSELAWLEQMKKKAQDKGEDEKMPLILSKEKGIIQKLKQEQDNINKMKEVQRKATENRLKLLSQHSEVVKWCQNKLKQQSILSQSLKTQEAENDEISTASTIASTASTTSSSTPTTTAVSTSTALVTHQDGDQLDESSLNLNNQSLIESKIMKQFQHLSSEKYLTEREKKLRLRRKHAEEIIAWKKKLDDEELKVREIEKQANQVLKEKPKQQQQSPKLKEKIKKTVDKSIVKCEQENELGDDDDNDDDEEIQTDIKTESKLVPLSSKTIATSINNENSYVESFESSVISKKIKDESVVQTSIINTVPISDGSDDTNKDSSSSSTSISEPSGTVSSSTSTSVKELEIKVKELKNEYLKKRNEAEKLGKLLKEAEKLKMKEKEEQLRKKIESYDHKLEKIKTALNQKQEKIEPKSEIKTEEIQDEESSSESSKQKYEEDFDTDKPQSATTKSSTRSSSEEKIQSEQVVVTREEDEKSTVSEISEDLILQSASQNNIKLDGLEDDNSNSLDSSTDTQILILGSSRQVKEAEKESHKEIEKFRRQDVAIQNFVKTYLNDLVDQMIEVRNLKTSKLLAEQYKETMDRLDDEKSSDDDELDDLLTTQKVKIPIPPIDLDEEYEEESKVKKLNDSKNEGVKPPVFNVPFTREKVSGLIDMAIEDYYWRNLSDLKSLLEGNFLDESGNLAKNSQLEDYFKPETESKEIEYNFKKMLLDLTGEFIHDLFIENYEQPEMISEYLPGYTKPLKRKHFKSYFKGPNDKDKVKELVKSKILSLLKLNVKEENSKIKVKSKWRVQKKLDLVDGLLDVEMREQEHEWSNYEIEEYEAKLHISNSIFDMLLKDTLDCVQMALIKKK